ncbi:MAG: hypothetical protein IJ081_06125 [Prevotella sp.]|nr:hypothetical protein [Prevotella sp.]
MLSQMPTGVLARHPPLDTLSVGHHWQILHCWAAGTMLKNCLMIHS